MSESTWRVGREQPCGLINHADETYCDAHGGHTAWSTEDLGDFAQGVLEAALEHLVTLRPENFHEISEQEAMLAMRRMDLHRH